MTNYKDTPIGEITTQAKRDMDLIQRDVEAKDWPSVISGVEYQVQAFTSLLEDLRKLQGGGWLHRGLRV